MILKRKSYIAIPILYILILLSAMLLRTIALKSVQVYSEQVSDSSSLNEEAVLERLSQALKYKTISYQDKSKVNTLEFNNFYKFLEESFPNVHKKFQKEKINDLSLLYKWEGSKKDSEAVLLMAHADVVPAEEEGWKYEPYSGTISEGYAWGRGALDMKNQLMGQFEALEELIKKGFQPTKTIYIAIGHDEEIGGVEGNAKVAAYIESKGIKLSLVLDEGGFIVKNMVPGVNAPVGVVGIAEKGYLTLELSAADNGGHSSMPPKHTAIGKLAGAVKKLEDSPFEAKVDGATREFISSIAPEMPLIEKLVFANMWFFKPIVVNKLSKSDNTNALLRTTMASTVIEGGIKENVLPQNAKALVNFRILPGESIDSVTERVRKTINDEQIKIKAVSNSWNPSEISDIESEVYKSIGRAARATFPNVIITPYLVVGSTDSRYYQKLTNNIFRFSPVEIGQDDLKSIHGVNEKISTESYIKMINFYCNCIEELQK